MVKINFADQHDYGYEVPPCSRRDLVEHAHAIHKAIGYKGDGPFPILELVEKGFYYLYDDYVFEVVSEAEMGDDLGKTWPNEHVIRVREDVYEAACEGQGFARMILGHESSHLLRHEGIPVSMACRKADKHLPAYKSSEWQANAMSGALLMPSCKIIEMSIDEIVEKYQVSTGAAEMQLCSIRKEARKWRIPEL